MASTDKNKPMDAWYTASLFKTLLCLFLQLVLILSVERILRGKFPSEVFGAVPAGVLLIGAIKVINEGHFQTQGLALSGFADSRQQRRNLRRCIFGMLAACIISLGGVYGIVIHKPHPLLYALLFIGANISGYFLTVWLYEASGMYAQLQTAIRTAGATPEIVAETPTVPLAPVASPLAAYKPMTPNSEAQAVRVGLGGKIDP